MGEENHDMWRVFFQTLPNLHVLITWLFYIATSYTCDKQVLWESAGAFFPRDNSLVSACKSHRSGVRGLVVRCLLFNPEGSCSNPWVSANFLTSISKQKVFTFSALWDSSLFSALWDFFRKFFNVLKGSSLQFVLIFCNRTSVKKSQMVPSLRFFGSMRLLKILFFRKFFKDSNVFPFNFFWNFATEWFLKNLKGPPFTVFGIVRKFKMNNFCLKIRFSEAQHSISEYCFF